MPWAPASSTAPMNSSAVVIHSSASLEVTSEENPSTVVKSVPSLSAMLIYSFRENTLNRRLDAVPPVCLRAGLVSVQSDLTNRVPAARHELRGGTLLPM